MKRLKLSWTLALLAAFSISQHVRADSLVNNFTTSSDWVAHGIVGDTNWDGVYLGFGDIPGGGLGGSGAGATTVGNTTFASGFLSVTTVGSDWSAAGDDGFYLWKLVSGDFDVSVESVNPWQAIDSNFGGLLVRAWNTNQSGGPVTFTGTNGPAENWLALFRFQQFALNEIREDTNGANVENTFPEGNTDTNSTRYLRITRTGDTFAFYIKTNASDSWTLITNASAGGGYTAASGSVTRPDWHNQPVQVGVAQAVFSRTAPLPIDFFTDFELSGPNVQATPGNLPAAPDTLVTSALNTNGSLTLSWNTNGGTGSIVLLRKITTASPGNVLVANPVQGLNYFWDTNYPDANTLVAGNTHVVYVGTGTNVTVTGLGGSNNVYSAEVISYNSTGPIIYNTANPATLGFLGAGLPSSISVSINPTNIPVNGVGAPQVIATFTTGEQVDVTSDPSVAYSSSDPTTILVTGTILQGLQPGTATISATYAGFTGQVVVPVTPFRYSDNFSAPVNYLQNGLPGSSWDGLFDQPGDVIGGNAGAGPVTSTAIDADITATNTLTVTVAGGDWSGRSDDGFLLFKNVTGDFQAVVHVSYIDRNLNTNSPALGDGGVSYMFGGLMARAAVTNGTENWVYWSEFDQFGDSTEARFAQNGADTEHALDDSQTKTNYWLLMQRVNGTNFFFYRKVNLTDPWEPHPELAILQPNLTNSVPMQVGLFQATYTGSSGTIQFDSFSLDANGLVPNPPMAIPAAATNLSMTLNQDISMTLQWTVPGTNSDGTALRSMVIMRAGAPIGEQPYLNFALGGDVANPSNPFGVADDYLGNGNYVVYRTPAGTTNLTQSVNITGLSPGVQYYAAVYTFILGTSRPFNTTSGTSANSPSATLLDGTLLGIQSSLSGNGIPLGGIGIPIVNGVFTGGGLANITSAVTITSDNSNVVLVAGNILSGMTLGSGSVHITYGGFTNVLSFVVRNPGYTDNFSAVHDYVVNGITNTTWDGVYLGANSFPNQGGGNDGVVSAADAGITTNNTLTVTHYSTDWAGANDDGFLLFKNVSGDFQTSVHVASLVKTNYQFAGVMARGFGTNGTPLVVGTNAPAENWIYWGEFEEFNDATESRRALAGADLEKADSDTNATNNWYILMARQNGTNFTFYRKLNLTDPWAPQTSQAQVQPNLTTGVPLQVGLFAATYTINVGTVQFDSFMLDVAAPLLNISGSRGNETLSWIDNSFTLESTPSLNPANWQPVTATATFTNGAYSVQLPVTTPDRYFRLVK